MDAEELADEGRGKVGPRARKKLLQVDLSINFKEFKIKKFIEDAQVETGPCPS